MIEGPQVQAPLQLARTQRLAAEAEDHLQGGLREEVLLRGGGGGPGAGSGAENPVAGL